MRLRAFFFFFFFFFFRAQPPDQPSIVIGFARCETFIAIPPSYTSGFATPFYFAVLCDAINALRPKSVVRVARVTVQQYKRVENLNSFLAAARTHFQLSPADCFDVADLFSDTNRSMLPVVRCINALAAAAVARGIKAADVISAREAEARSLEFSASELAAVESVLERDNDSASRWLTGSSAVASAAPVSSSAAAAAVRAIRSGGGDASGDQVDGVGGLLTVLVLAMAYVVIFARNVM